MKYIYGTESAYSKKHKNVSWSEYQKNILMAQPLWWILESLDFDKKPKGQHKKDLINNYLDDLWDIFKDGLDVIN